VSDALGIWCTSQSVASGGKWEMNKLGTHEICSVSRGQATSLAETNMNSFIAVLWSFVNGINLQLCMHLIIL